VLTAYPFGPDEPVTVEIGQTYYFRVRARDFAGNQEPYPAADGDTHIRIVESMPPAFWPAISTAMAMWAWLISNG